MSKLFLYVCDGGPEIHFWKEILCCIIHRQIQGEDVQVFDVVLPLLDGQNRDNM